MQGTHWVLWIQKLKNSVRHLRRWTLEPSALPRPLGPNDPPESRQPGRRAHAHPAGTRHPDPEARQPDDSQTQWVRCHRLHSINQGDPGTLGAGTPSSHHRATQWVWLNLSQWVIRGCCDTCAFRAGEAQDLILFQWVIYFRFSGIDPLNQKGALSPHAHNATQRVREST